MKRMAIATLVVLAALLPSRHVAAEAFEKQFVLKDYLNRHWRSELVTYDVAVPLDVNTGALRLHGPDGKPVPVQMLFAPDEAKDGLDHGEVSFLADVPPFGTSTYRLAEGAEQPPGADLKVDENAKRIRLENGLIGVEMPGTIEGADAGPISAVRLRSGAWMGGGRFTGRKIKGYQARLGARGPVFAEAQCRYVFADETSWEVRLRVIAGQPVVLVAETFNFSDADSSWAFRLNAGLNPGKLTYPTGYKPVMKTIVPAAEGGAFELTPWAGWWGGSKAKFFGLYADGGDDFLLVSARDCADWVVPLPRSLDPYTRCNRAPDVHVPVRSTEGRLEMVLPFPPNGRARRWVIAALSKEEALAEGAPALPVRLAIQYGELPLDRVKDYVLEWPGTEEHPRLYVSKKDAARIGRMGNPDPGEGDVFRYFATGDEAVGKKIAATARKRLQNFIDRFTVQKLVTPRGDSGSGHHCQDIVNPMDAILDAPFLTEKERTVLRAQLAFAAYELASPHRCSPRRGWSANPNMTCNWYSSLGELACLISSHPHARRWFDRAYEEIRLELDTWAGPNGGWIEPPHYMSTSLCTIIPFAIAARNSGYADFVHDPKIKKTLRYRARIATPRDPDCGGRRLAPCVGNTYHGETTALHAWAAKLWEEMDPAFSQEMQWMWYEQGKMRYGGIGGRSPGLAHYRPLLQDEGLPRRAPQWGSESFPAVGVVFRSAFPGDRETYMLFRHGPFAEHWDLDEGSFILYGKGRPLMRDWSYNPYTPHAWLHNRVVNNHSDGTNGPGFWNEFAALQAFARLGRVVYARSRQETSAGEERRDTTKKRRRPLYAADWPFRQRQPNGPLTWERQILFVKDDDPAQPSYFVVGDTTEGKTWMEWCMWFCAAGALDVSTNPVVVAGRHDVDAHLFFAAPAKRELHTLHAEQDGLGPKISQELVHFAQPAGTPILVVLYPYVRGQEQPPKFTALAGGRGVRVAGAFGVDVNVVSRREIDFREGDVSFHCRVGSVQDRADRLTLCLPEGGRLSLGGYALAAGGAVAVDIAKGRREILIRTDGRASATRLRLPDGPDGWQGTSQNVLRVEGDELVIALPEGWSSIRLLGATDG